MADWEDLHVEILVSILEKVRFIDDFLAFGCVCKSWREAMINNKQYLRPQLPWLMLRDKEDHQQILDLSREVMSTRNLYIPEMSHKCCIGLNYGWVLTTSWTGEMHLFHLLSRNRIELLNWKSLTRHNYWTASRAALSANPLESSDFAVMIVYCASGSGSGSGSSLGYWRSVDKQWTRIKNQVLENLYPVESKTWYSDVIHYGDRFYALEYNGKVWDCSVSNPQDPALVVELSPHGALRLAYIVESKGDLLVVARYFKLQENSEEEDEETGFRTHKFQVYKLDLINRGYKQVKSLGGEAIFVGQNTSISLDVSELGGGLFESDHIYFTDDSVGLFGLMTKGKGTDMVSYGLEDDQIMRIKVDASLICSYQQPFWFIPSL